MSNKVGERLLIGTIVLIASFAVFVTARRAVWAASTYALQSV